MGSVGPMHLICLLISVAALAAISGYVAAALRQRTARRARGYFVVGLGCGLVASAVLRSRRRLLRLVAAGIGPAADGIAARALAVVTSRR